MTRIAVVTSGGGAPGMNAAIRAVVRSAEAVSIEAFGVRNGFAGLIDGLFQRLDARAVSGIVQLGGTMLGSARSPRFRTTEGRREALKHLDLADIDGLVVIGGEGSFHGADALSREGHVRVVGIPGTIDHDLGGTDCMLGFDSAANTALAVIDRIRDTAGHRRLFVIEVMGRRSGWLTLYAGLAGGATEALVPERPADLDRLRERIHGAFALGERCCLVVVAEGDEPGGAYAVAERISEGLDADYQVATLGPVQRGGSPTMRDRVLGAILGDEAVAALRRGADRVMVGLQAGTVVHTPLERAWTSASPPPEDLLALMHRLAG